MTTDVITNLRNCKGVIFDLDGTLTKPQHDFDAIRRLLNIPQGSLILEYLASLPPTDAARRYKQLDEIERELATQSQAGDGAMALLAALTARKKPIAILTRNSRDNALLSLAAMHASGYFRDELVIGRDEAPAKPDPAGIHLLARRMGLIATDCLMVGDYRHDLEAGRNAGCLTVHLAHSSGEAWPEHTDHAIRSLNELAHLIP